MDRGPYTKECIDRLLRIETSLGFKLIALYGNHELMNFYNEAAPYVSQRDLLRGDAREALFSLDGAIWRSLTPLACFSLRTSRIFRIGALSAGIGFPRFGCEVPIQ